MATDTITVVPTEFGWSTTAYSMQYQGLAWLSGSNPALAWALCGSIRALEGGRAGAMPGGVRYIYIQTHRLGKLSVNHRSNCQYIHAQVLCNCLFIRHIYPTPTGGYVLDK